MSRHNEGVRMKFRRIIIFGNGVRTKPIGAAARVVSMILINTVTLNAQVASPGHATGPEAPVIPQSPFPSRPYGSREATAAS